MKQKNTSQKPTNKGLDREARLKAALKENMKRRKSQARARSDQEPHVAKITQEQE